MKNAKLKLNLEPVTKTDEGSLIGGFTMSITSTYHLEGRKNQSCPITNNCKSGNCVKGCSAKNNG